MGFELGALVHEQRDFGGARCDTAGPAEEAFFGDGQGLEGDQGADFAVGGAQEPAGDAARTADADGERRLQDDPELLDLAGLPVLNV